MQAAAAFDRVRECLIQALELDEAEVGRIDLYTTAADLEKWNSLGHLALLLHLEEQFGIEFEDEDTVAMGSVAAIIRAIDSKRP